MEIHFEMVISFDYTAPAINKYFDNVVFIVQMIMLGLEL